MYLLKFTFVLFILKLSDDKGCCFRKEEVIKLPKPLQLYKWSYRTEEEVARYRLHAKL